MDMNDVWVFGDSLAIGWPDLLAVPTGQVFVEGGSRITDQWTPGGEFWLEYIEPQDLTYAEVIVSLGFNDLWLDVAPGGPTGVPAWALNVHVEAFVTQMIEVKGAARVLWCVPPGSPPVHIRRACADSYMAVFEALERSTPLERIDWWRYMGRDHFGDPSGPDKGVHMNELGHHHAAALIRAVLEK